jgi:hypothetical protein
LTYIKAKRRARAYLAAIGHPAIGKAVTQGACMVVGLAGLQPDPGFVAQVKQSLTASS